MKSSRLLRGIKAKILVKAIAPHDFFSDRTSEMKRTAIILALILSTPICAASPRSYAAEFEDLLSGSQVPLTLKLSDLDDSWRLVSIGGQFEMGDLLQTYSTLFGGQDNNRGVYYTQGESVTVGGETYIIAYRISTKAEPVNFGAMLGNILGMAGCEGPSATPLTLETPLTLSLLNLRTVGSLNDIRPLSLQQLLAESEQAVRDRQAACQKAQMEYAMAQVSSSLEALGWALRSYAEENDGVLPKMDNSEAVKAVLEERVGDSSVFIHPQTSEPYQPNPSLSGRKLAEIPNPERVVAFYESSPAADGTRSVVYLNGAVERVAAADWLGVQQNSGLP